MLGAHLREQDQGHREGAAFADARGAAAHREGQVASAQTLLQRPQERLLRALVVQCSAGRRKQLELFDIMLGRHKDIRCYEVIGYSSCHSHVINAVCVCAYDSSGIGFGGESWPFCVFRTSATRGDRAAAASKHKLDGAGADETLPVVNIYNWRPSNGR